MRMPTNSTRSRDPGVGGGPRARWEEGPLGFVYTFFKDKDAVGNVIRLLKIPLVQVIVMAVVMSAFAACGFAIAAMIHQPAKIRWIASGTTACAPAAYYTARRVLRIVSERRRRRRQQSGELVPDVQQIIDAALESPSPSTPQPPPAGSPAGAPPPQ